MTFFDSVSEAFEKAKNSDCPRRLSGAARRKLANLQKKNVAELTENEKKFQEFAEYCKNARDDFFRGRKGTQRNSMNKTQDEPKNHQEKPKAEVQEKPNIEVQGNSNIEVQDEPKSDVNSEEISESEAKIPRDTSEVVSSN